MQHIIDETSPSMKRIKLIIGRINKIELKLEIVIDLLNNVFPWCEETFALAKKYCNYNHALAEKISNLLQYEGVFKILQKYDIGDLNTQEDVIQFI